MIKWIKEKFYMLKNKHWIIKTELPKKVWHDVDQRMLWSVMELVRFYIEEDGDHVFKTRKDLIDDEYFQNLDPQDSHQLKIKNSIIHQMELDEQIKEIYDWFQDYKKLHSEGYYFDLTYEEEEELEQEATQMMIKACELRQYMWS